VEQRTVIAAHTESCAQCLKELTWLRTESGLFAERAKRTPVPQLWTQVEQQLARPSVQPSRGRWAMGTQTKQWLAVGAAAAAMVMMSLGAFSPLRLRDSAVDWLRKPFAGASGVDSKHHAAAASDAADSEADESDSHSASLRGRNRQARGQRHGVSDNIWQPMYKSMWAALVKPSCTSKMARSKRCA
jgi:hypothetical protein